nr:MAG TPA: hypothetical protein [Caudoviricetes sp.]
MRFDRPSGRRGRLAPFSFPGRSRRLTWRGAACTVTSIDRAPTTAESRP